MRELEVEIAALQEDLATTADQIVSETWHEAEIHAPHPT
jgi:hypothetical protein